MPCHCGPDRIPRSLVRDDCSGNRNRNLPVLPIVMPFPKASMVHRARRTATLVTMTTTTTLLMTMMRMMDIHIPLQLPLRPRKQKEPPPRLHYYGTTNVNRPRHPSSSWQQVRVPIELLVRRIVAPWKLRIHRPLPGVAALAAAVLLPTTTPPKAISFP